MVKNKKKNNDQSCSNSIDVDQQMADVHGLIQALNNVAATATQQNNQQQQQAVVIPVQQFQLSESIYSRAINSSLAKARDKQELSTLYTIFQALEDKDYTAATIAVNNRAAILTTAALMGWSNTNGGSLLGPADIPGLKIKPSRDDQTIHTRDL